MSALVSLTTEAGPAVEAHTRTLDTAPGDDATRAELAMLAGRLAAARDQEADAPVTATAESLVLEAACLLLRSPDGGDEAQLALERLDEAVSRVEEAWPALRMSVLLRALALAAPLTREGHGLARDAEQRLQRWATLAAAARRRQTELEAEAASDLALADHLASRLAALAPDDRDRVTERAREHADAARLAAAFAGDRALAARARALADRLA